MLKTETNTETMRRRILRAFRALYGIRARAVFEHGQWWVLDSSTYSVVDAQGVGTIDGFDFERVS